jgi:predicted double-glycine peptidase
MPAWLESVAVLLICGCALLFGYICTKLPRSYWLLGYLVPLSAILLYIIAIFVPAVGDVPPVSWMMIGRSRFIAFGFLIILMLATPLRKLPNRRTRVVVLALIFVLTCSTVLPFLAPVFNRSYLRGLKTKIDSEGVCRQSNDYTCGPAAAVTALRKLGFEAEEGEIAILSHTSSFTGTEPDIMASVLQKRYRDQGLIAEYRGFRNLDELKNSGLTVAVVKFNVLMDHCVTVLEVRSNAVAIADPLNGLTSMSPKEFEDEWQFVGIVLQRR